jgi:CheY-like chemotaxis protein
MIIQARQYLLVDDDFDDQEIFSIALRTVDPGGVCIFANDGEHAIRLLRNEPIHPLIIFIDMNMPRMNGVDCLKSVKDLKRFSDTPVYMISTAGNPTIIEECKQHGAIDYIIKSPSLSELENRLSGIITEQIPRQTQVNGKK